MLRIYRVINDSMRPGLTAGDFVIARRRRRPPRAGERVVVDHPNHGVIIKRVASVASNGNLICQSDNPAGLSPEQLGPIAQQRIRGIVCWSIRA